MGGNISAKNSRNITIFSFRWRPTQKDICTGLPEELAEGKTLLRNVSHVKKVPIMASEAATSVISPLGDAQHNRTSVQDFQENRENKEPRTERSVESFHEPLKLRRWKTLILSWNWMKPRLHGTSMTTFKEGREMQLARNREKRISQLNE